MSIRWSSPCRGRSRLVAVLIAFLLHGSAAADRPAIRGERAHWSKLTLTQLRNAFYKDPMFAPKGVRLRNGTYERDDLRIGKGYVKFWFEKAAWGDLDGDGNMDAAVCLVETEGGSGAFFMISAVLNRRGKPFCAAGSGDIGDRIDVRSMKIMDGRIILEAAVQAEHDPMACPTRLVRRVYGVDLAKHRITMVSERKLRTLPRR